MSRHWRSKFGRTGSMLSTPLLLYGFALIMGAQSLPQSHDPASTPLNQTATVGGVQVIGQTDLSAQGPDVTQSYVLGPEDKLNIKVLDLDVINDKDVFRVDTDGDIDLPLIGRVHVAGFTTEQAEGEIKNQLTHVLQKPEVTVTVLEFRPQAVSVLGAVRNPSQVQIIGRRNLYEVLSLAGGLSPDAGETIRITRDKRMGRLPLPGATDDPSGQYYTAVLNVRSVMLAKNLNDNIQVLPRDVILVKRADLVYVMGAVRKPGGFVLNEREKISVLQVLALAEGLVPVAASGNARIIRTVGDADTRIELPVDVKKLLTGKGNDTTMVANDILFVPTSASKNIAIKGLESAISIGTGLAIYSR